MFSLGLNSRTVVCGETLENVEIGGRVDFVCSIIASFRQSQHIVIRCRNDCIIFSKVECKIYCLGALALYRLNYMTRAAYFSKTIGWYCNDYIARPH